MNCRNNNQSLQPELKVHYKLLQNQIMKPIFVIFIVNISMKEETDLRSFIISYSLSYDITFICKFDPSIIIYITDILT